MTEYLVPPSRSRSVSGFGSPLRGDEIQPWPKLRQLTVPAADRQQRSRGIHQCENVWMAGVFRLPSRVARRDSEAMTQSGDFVLIAGIRRQMRRRHRAGQKTRDDGIRREMADRSRVRLLERPDSGADQRRHDRSAVQSFAQIASQRADVRSGTAFYVERQLRRFKSDDFESMNLDRLGLEFNRLAAPRKFVRATPGHSHCGIRGRHLLDATTKLVERSIQLRAGDRSRSCRVGFDNLSGHVVRVAALAEQKRSAVRLRPRLHQFDQARRMTDGDHQDSSRHRVKRSRVTHFRQRAARESSLAEQPIDMIHDRPRCQSLWFVDVQEAVHSVTRQLTDICTRS